MTPLEKLPINWKAREISEQETKSPSADEAKPVTIDREYDKEQPLKCGLNAEIEAFLFSALALVSQTEARLIWFIYS